MTPLFEPWLNYHHPIVRQLAFVIASPNILRKLPNDLATVHDFELHSDAFWTHQFNHYQSRLAELDQQPDELITFIAQLKSTRLGLRFEYLMWFWLQDDAYHDFQIIGHSIQIIEGRHTVGELDFLLLNRSTQQIEHWEVALKFYLAEPSLCLADWYGLNRSDTLLRKLKHFTQKQFQFNRIHAHQIDRKFAVLKGQLYLPIDSATLTHRCDVDHHHPTLKSNMTQPFDGQHLDIQLISDEPPQKNTGSNELGQIPDWINRSRRIGTWGNHIQANFYRIARQEWICPHALQSSANAIWWYDGLYRNYHTLDDFMFRQAEYIHSTVKIM